MPSQAKHYVITAANKAVAVPQLVSELMQLEAQKEHLISIKERKLTRSNKQNSLYWLWLSEISQHTGQSTKSLHYYFKKEYLIPIFRRNYIEYEEMIKSVVMLKKLGESTKTLGHFIVSSTSTTKAKTNEMAEYLGLVERNGIEQGAALTNPTLYGLENY